MRGLFRPHVDDSHARGELEAGGRGRTRRDFDVPVERAVRARRRRVQPEVPWSGAGSAIDCHEEPLQRRGHVGGIRGAEIRLVRRRSKPGLEGPPGRQGNPCHQGIGEDLAAGGDCLFAQALLEPKAAIDSVRIALRCYPSAFVSDADRHVLTSTRDFAQGERAELDVATQWWTLYYDSIYDAGYIGPTRSGAGPCAALWLPGQTENARFSVASYGIETVLDLKPTLRDFRFVFFDYAGKKNEAAKSDLRGRAPALLEELATFTFTDPSLANWPLPRKLAEIRQVLASVPQDKDSAAQYEVWSRKLAAQLELMRSGAAGTIMAEAETAEIIGQWQSRLPALKLQALLNEI